MTHAIITLTQRADFLRLNRGRKWIGDSFILRSARAPDASSDLIRIGYTVTTKCGNAVIRNRIKRRLRAAVRELAPSLAQPGYDYVFIARAGVTPNGANIPYASLREGLRRAFASVTPS